MAGFDADRIDEVIHGRIRLGVMAYMSGVESATFVELRDVLNATAGNLSVALTKLEEAGYISSVRTIENKRTVTTVRVTGQGRAAWIAYLANLEALVVAAKTSQDPKSRR